MTAGDILLEAFFVLTGLLFVLVGIKALRDGSLRERVPTALFWFLLAFTFIAGPWLPDWVTGLCIVLTAVLTALGKVKQSASDVPAPEQTRKNADRVGGRVFLPALALAVSAVLAATLLPFGASNAIGISALFSLAVALLVFRVPAREAPVAATRDGVRLMDSIGPVGILPQVLAALGALFTAAGVGEVISGAVAAVMPQGSRLAAVALYCVGMALFTVVMGNGFAAFSVITAGIGIPFIIAQGGDPVVVGTLGLTAGYCGTLVTPMAANFNIMPAALLEMRQKYGIIKVQAPVAAIMLALHIALMYTLAF